MYSDQLLSARLTLIYALAVRFEVRGSSLGAFVWCSDTVPSSQITSVDCWAHLTSYSEDI